MINVLVENLKEKNPQGLLPFLQLLGGIGPCWGAKSVISGQNPLAYFPPGRGRHPVTRVPSGDAQVQVFASEVLF